VAGVSCWLIAVALSLGRRTVGLVGSCGMNCFRGLVLSAHVVAMLGLRVGVRIPVVRHVRLHLRLRLLVDGDLAAALSCIEIGAVVKNRFINSAEENNTSADDRIFANEVLV